MSAALPCSLQTLMKIGDFVATERAVCAVCQKPANHSCVRCKLRYCSKVLLCVEFNALMRTGMSDKGLENFYSQTRLSGLRDYAEMVFISLEQV